MAHSQDRSTRVATLLIAGLLVVVTLHNALGAPTGASILFNATAGSPSASASSMINSRGTITTVNLNALQQDQQWKAYVGNVTGRLSLDNADGFTIYDWELSGAIAGEVYVSRAASPEFTNVSCANIGNITAQYAYYNMTNGQVDNINATFNETSHASFFVGTLSISANSCPSGATFVNDTRQIIDGSQDFQQVVLQDNSTNLLFVALIDDNRYSYDNNISINRTYDFQLLVPDSDVNSTPTTYYFWTELDG